MKLVLDTNVLVSALISPFGPPARVLDLALSGDVTLHFDDRIMAEYRDVLGRPRFGFDPDDVSRLLSFVHSEGNATVAVIWPRSLPDPNDGAFVEVAAAAKATLARDGQHAPLPNRGRRTGRGDDASGLHDALAG